MPERFALTLDGNRLEILKAGWKSITGRIEDARADYPTIEPLPISNNEFFLYPDGYILVHSKEKILVPENKIAHISVENVWTSRGIQIICPSILVGSFDGTVQVGLKNLTKWLICIDLEDDACRLAEVIIS